MVGSREEVPLLVAAGLSAFAGKRVRFASSRLTSFTRQTETHSSSKPRISAFGGMTQSIAVCHAHKLFGMFFQKCYGPGPGGLRGFQIGSGASGLSAEETMAGALVYFHFISLF